MCKVCDAEGALLGELERVVLENTEPGHNKQYTIWLEKVEGGWKVVARYGPIGKWTKTVTKSDVLGSMSEARNFQHTLERVKIGRGYVPRVCASR